MAVRSIRTAPDPVLKRKARPVAEFGPRVQQLIEDMIETMRAAPGVGLAAPQIGVGQRVIVVEYGQEKEDEPGSGIAREDVPPKLYVVLNPELVRPSAEMVKATEGCLSIPGFAGEVERHAQVTVKGVNRRGAPVRIRASGWLARIFQHEVDHLNGVLFPDRAERIWKVEAEEEPERV